MKIVKMLAQIIFGVAYIVVVMSVVGAVVGIAMVSLSETYRDDGWVGLILHVSLLVVGIGGIMIWLKEK